ncbi:TetR/AcrR family transcriptional regulator [Williamsia sp. Leaf354]|uniref:TetR/AcrR family transcriptional regulator n=1 Tax=Williamsia sp. Leaf354 TaxID=1736349 RepID=UPI0009EC2A81|nr:TetR/AcrR family transcriptional regulator [Williamsia sp. Leaf354]
MPARQTTAAAARAAVVAAANATKGLEAALRGAADDIPDGKPDGRKQRWQQHKEERRAELVDGTLTAVRALGADIGMDEIASHIGVSKTVLYRYFTDKNDLNTAAMVRFIEVTLLPRLTEALIDDVDEFTMTRAVISIYVQTIADETQIYTFVTSSKFSSPTVLADSEKLIAQVVAFAMNERLSHRGLDTSGFETWAYALVGGVQLATHWWMVERTLSQEQLIDHLTMLVWTSFVGIAEVGGSAAVFNSREHPLPEFGVVPSTTAT